MNILGKTREQRDADAKQRYYEKHPEKIRELASRYIENNSTFVSRNELRSDLGLPASVEYTPEGIAQKKQQEAARETELKQQRLWADENQRRIQAGRPLQIVDGRIYSYVPLTKDILQKSIDWADSDIARYKEKGGSSTKIGEFTDKLLTYAGYGDKNKSRSDSAEEIGYYSDLLREREGQRAVYLKYFENAEYEEAMAEIKKNGDGELFSELFAIDSRKDTLLDALSNIGSSGSILPSGNAGDIVRESEIKADLQNKYGDNFKKYRELYAKGANSEFTASLVKKMEDTIEEHPVLGTIGYTLGNVVTAPVRGVGALSDSINNAMGNYGAASGGIFQDMSDATVRKVNEEINEKFKNPYAAGLLETVYGAAVSIGESMMSAGAFGKAGEAILGLNAATSAFKDGKARGLSDGQALVSGIAAGIFEALFEHMSLEKLRVFQASPSTTLKPFIKNVLKQSVAEGGEEFFTDVANEAYDYFVNGGLSQYEEALRNGVTPEEYGKQFLAQLRETFITGALAGGGMIGMSAAPGATLGSVSQVMTDMKQGSKIRSEGETANVINSAKKQGGNVGRKAAKIEKLIAEGESVTDRKIGQLDRKTTKAERERAVDGILSSADYKEVSGKEKRAIRSSVLTYLSTGGEVSYEQKQVLDTENGTKVLEAAQKWEIDKVLKIGSERAERRSTNIKKALDEGNTESLVKNTFSAVNAEGHKVSVGAVRSITDGEFEVVQDVQTGATAKLSELKIEDRQARELYKNLQELATGENPLTVEAVNVALSMYNTLDNTSARAYSLWVHDAYKAGSVSLKNTVLSFPEFEEMFHNKYDGDINKQQLREIYEIGARNLNVNPGVTRVGRKGLSKLQAEQVFILHERAKQLGLEIVLVAGRLTDENGRDVNALYIEGTNRIVLSLQNELGLTLVHAGHEIFHWAKNQNREGGAFLQDMVINVLKSDSRYDYEGIYKQIANEYEGLNEGALLEEIAAQYLGVVFANEDGIRKTVAAATAKQRSFLKKMVDYLRDFIKSLKELIRIYGDSDKTVRAAVETPVDQLQYIADTFEEILKKTAERKKPATETGGVKASRQFNNAKINNEIINLVNRVKENNFKPNEVVDFGTVNRMVAAEIMNLTGFDVSDYRVVIEARQIEHILKDHGENGKTDHSLSDTADIAKMGFVLNEPDSISNAGRTQAYSYMEKGHNRTAKTVLYEKRIGEKSYYVVQAVPITKAKKLFVVSAFIGEQGYKKEASQLINANSPDATTEYGSAILSNNTVTQNAQSVNNNDMQKEKKDTNKYSVKRDVDGNKFVDVNPEMFDARDGESHAKTIARIIKDRFNNLISVNGQQIQINKTTNREWLRSESATYLAEKHPSLYLDKLKTIPYADEILKAANNWIGEKPNHKRKDDIIEFARGEVLYRVGDNGYIADVLVGIRSNGAAVLYSLKNIYEKEITDASLAMASESPQRSEETSVMDNISQFETDVKEKYSRRLTAETEEGIEQMKLENESFFQYLERLGDKIGNQIKAKRAPDSELVYDRASFYEIAKKYNLFDADAENGFNKNKYSDTELVNSMENVMVGISDGLISPAAGLERLARIQQDILRSGYELRYGKDKNGKAISEEAANAFKKDIRNKPIYVSKYTYSLLMEQYKTRRNLRNASFNQLSIREEDSENVPNIELLYGELLKKHPALLDNVTEQLDMINELISTGRAVRPQVEYVSEKEGFKGFLDLSEAGVRRAADMLTEAFNVELVQGNLQQQYKELRSVRQSLDRTKKYYRNLLEDSARIRSEREEKTACIKRIVRTTRRLDKLLRKETDTKHIPEGLKEPVAKFLQIIQGSLKNSFDESLIDDSLSIAELNKAYAAYSTENTANTDEEYSEKLSQLQFVLHGDKRLRELSIEDLKTVEDVVTHFNFIVNEGNQMFVDELKRRYEHTASVSVENLYPHIENRKKGLERMKDAEFKMLTPYMFFKHIGTHFEGAREVTEILGELGNALFKGEEKTARNVEKVKNKTQEIMKTWGYDSRWASDERDIVLESGQKVSMTTEKIMHTLAMYDREESKGFKTDHILAGGIVVNGSAHKTVTGIIKPIPEAIKTRRAFNKAKKEREARLKDNGGKIFVGMNDADRARILTETALEVINATDVVIREDVEKQVEELKTKYEGSSFKVIRELGDKFGVFKDYTNDNVQLNMNYSIGSAKKSINVAEKNGEDINDFVKMLSVFDEVIKNAQPVEVHTDKYKGTIKENTNLKQAYVLLSAFQDGNSIIPVEFVVKEYKERNKNQLYVSVNLKRIEAGVSKAGKNNPRNTFRPASEAEVSKAVEPKSPDTFRPTSIFRLTDIISNVNPLDSEFLKYIPASMLDEQQIVGRNEGIRKEKLRIAEIERTGEVNVSAEVTEDEQRALAEKIAETMRVYISKKDIQMLREQLNGQQTGYYKALVKAMSEDGAALGNETSLKLFGTKKYTEEKYCPASVVSDYLLERFGVKDVGEKRLKNRSFTKRITENANAPILIDNISEIYAKHMYEMCTYNAMTIPLESIERLLNYKLPDEYERVGDKIQIKKGKSYRELFREAFGDRGLQYLENLMRDLNGGIRVDNRGALNSMMTNFKRSAVSASLTVAFQQPGAVARAMFRISPRYFTLTAYMPLLDKVTGKYTDFFDRYDELLKYCPLAVIKDIGKFDTNVGQSYEEWILDVKPRFRKSIKEVDRIAPWLYHKTEDLFMWLPGYLDKATWLHIWNAVKRETAHKNGVRVSKLTEKMLTEAGERMSQVIRETQVYDSVLSRSDLMRSKNALTQMATSFMAEPTVTYNMMRYAATTAKYQPKVLVRAIASMLCSIMLTDFLKNLAKAIRYDDEESNFGEMLLSGTVVDIISDLNPLTYIPYVKDIWSMFEGYDIERVDMSVFSKVVDAIKPFLDSEEEITYAHWEQLGITLSMFTGIPINNLMKDITGIKARFKKGSPEFSGTAVGNTIRTELSENPFIKATGKLIPPIYNFFNMSDERVIYNAILNEDEATLDRYRGYSEDDVENYVDKGHSFLDASLKASDNAESNFHSKVVDGLISEDSRIEEAAEARLDADTDTYEELLEELSEQGFDRNDVIKAVEKYIASMEDKTYESSESKDKAPYDYSDLFNAINSDKMSDAKHIFDKLSQNVATETVQENIRDEYAEAVYKAILNGNKSQKEQFEKIFEEFDYDYHYAVILGLKENDSRISDAAAARYSGDFTEYERIKTDIVADGFDENDVFNAIEGETEKLAPKAAREESHPEDSYLYENADLSRYAKEYNLDASKRAIKALRDRGKKDGDIRKSLTEVFKTRYIEAWKTGNYTEIDKIRSFLEKLDVGYKESTFNAWEKAANQKE